MKPENQLKVIALSLCSIVIMVAFITFVSIKTTEAVAHHGGGEHGASTHDMGGHDTEEHKDASHTEEHKTEEHKDAAHTETKTEEHKDAAHTETKTEEHKDAAHTETKTEEHKDAAHTETKTEEHKDAAHTETKTVSGDVEAGKKVFLKASSLCVTCHKVQGVPEAVGVVGPELTGLGELAATRKAGMSVEAYLKESIENPNAFVVEGFAPAMPPNLNASMSEDEYKNLIAYLASL